MKKGFVILILLLLCVRIPFSVSADESEYYFDSSTGTITGYQGNDADLVIPAQIGNIDVKAIGDNVFIQNTNITSVIIPDTVDKIGDSAFNGCLSLKTVVILGNIDTIYTQAFEECTSLTTIDVQGSLEWISYAAFRRCTSLESINISGDVGRIVNDAFYGCSSLKNISIQGDVGRIEEMASDTLRSLENFSIGGDIEVIGEYAFYNCTNLVNFNFGTKLTTIDSFAFYGTGLTNVALPETVKSINGAFGNCKYLTNITVASANPDYSSDNGILFNKSQTEIIQYPAGKSETSYIIPSNVANVASGTFTGSQNLTSVTILQNVVGIHGGAFDQCINLENIFVNDSNVHLSSINGILLNKDQTILLRYPAGKPYNVQNIPNSVNIIGIGAFQGCVNITSIVLSNRITSIEDSAFSNCLGLTSIELSNRLLSIGNSAFSGCAALTSINLPDSIISIGRSAFIDCTSLTSISLPNSITTIQMSTFYNCNNLRTILLSNKLETIETMAFQECNNLEKIYIPNSVTYIARQAFYNCSSMTDVEVGTGVATLDSNVFSGCASLKNIKFYNPNFKFGSDYIYNNVFYLSPELTIYVYKGSNAMKTFENRDNVTVCYFDRSISVKGDKVTLLIDTEKPIPAGSLIILAAFDSNRRFIGISIANATVEMDGSNTTEYTFDNIDTTASIYRSFVWNNMEQMQPILNSY